MKWLKYVLSTLNPDHIYFSKGFYPSDIELGFKERKSTKK